MSVLSIDYPIEGMSAEKGADTQSQTETAIVVFTIAPATALEAINLSGFRQGMSHRIMHWLSIEDGSLTASPMDSGLEWEITAKYSSQGSKVNYSDELEEFRTRVIPFNWSYTKVVTNDKETGDPIETYAGDPIDPPFMQIVPNIGWRITLRETNANVQRNFLQGNVNNATFQMLGIKVPKYCAQLSNYIPNPQYDEDGTLYFLNTYEIKLNFALAQDKKTRIGFKSEVLSAGFNQLKVADDKTGGTNRIYGQDRQPVNRMVKLGTNGQVTDDAVYQQWTINDLTSFSAFGLPLNYPSFQNA